MFDDFLNYLHQLKVYALGKGILSFAVFGAAAVGSAIGGAALVWPAALVMAIGGVALTAASRLYRQSLYENDMVALYRGEIAQQLHIAPEEVRRTHLHQMAEINPVIAQALRRQHAKTVLTISTAVLAGAVSLVMLGAFNAGGLLHELAQQNFTGILEPLEPLARLVGMGTVAAASSLLLHNGLDAAIGYSTDIGRHSATDMILCMQQRLQRGQAISREEVYGVLVAGDEALSQRIAQQFGTTYGKMNYAQQSQVLRTLGLAESMDALAQHLSQHHSGISKLAFVNPEMLQSAAPAIQMSDDAKSNFVERLGLAPKQAIKHTERLAAQEMLQPELAR